MRDSGVNSGRINMLAITAAILIAVSVACCFGLFEDLDASDIMIVQAPTSGELTLHTTPGMKWQGFGTCTKYKKRSQFWFSVKADQGAPGDDSIKIRFNDGGHAQMSGSLAFELPLDADHMFPLHNKYRSQDAIAHQLVRTITEKSVYMTGPLMSSAESYAARRNDLLNLVNEQIQHGVFKTESSDQMLTDQMGIQKTVRVVNLKPSVKSGDFGYEREEESPLTKFGISTYNLSINAIDYDPMVENQIQAQQQMIMNVQTSIANSKKAEQETITTAKTGEAAATKAKWEQETINAKVVAEAEMRVKVATLELEGAELKKKSDIASGEGEAKKRELIMEADGALDKKLTAWLDAQKYYASAIGSTSSALVPAVVMGGSGASSSGSGIAPLDILQMIGVRTAMDLGMDMSVGRKGVQRPMSMLLNKDVVTPVAVADPIQVQVEKNDGLEARKRIAKYTAVASAMRSGVKDTAALDNIGKQAEDSEK